MVKSKTDFGARRFGVLAPRFSIRPDQRNFLMNSSIPTRHRTLALVAAVLILASQASLRAESKLKPEELIAKHLERLAAPELLQKRDSSIARGFCDFKIIVGGSAMLHGETLLLSRGRDLSEQLQFGVSDYPAEHYVVKDGDVSVAYTTPGRRSPLGEFLLAQKTILKEGLFGGVLTTAWPLLEFPERHARANVKGVKKIDGRELYVMEYVIPRSGNLRVELRFDPVTFDHVETFYSLRISAGQSVTPEAAGRTRSIRHTLTETFGDFQESDGYRLPTSWVVQYSRDGDGPSLIWEWRSKLDQFSQDQEIPPDRFHLQ